METVFHCFLLPHIKITLETIFTYQIGKAKTKELTILCL